MMLGGCVFGGITFSQALFRSISYQAWGKVLKFKYKY